MDAVVYLQPALILHHRPYRETSLILEVFTQDYGVIAVIAKGVRQQKSKTAGLLQPFSQLSISYLNKHGLKTLTQVEFVVNYALQGLALYCGFYVNELVQKFLHRDDPHPELFKRYQACLQGLLQPDGIEQSLRYFELDLLQAAGYGVQLEFDVNAQTLVNPALRYNFVADFGIIADADGPVSGSTLLSMAAGELLSATALAEAKQLTRKMLDVHLYGKALKSREVLAKIIKYL